MIIFTRWILTGLLALFWYGVFKIVENYAVNWSHVNWSLVP
jgi:hypothetical protein